MSEERTRSDKMEDSPFRMRSTRVALEGLPGDFRLVAAALAAAADDLVVEPVHVPELAGVAGFPAIEMPVPDDAQAEAPVHVEEQHVPAPDAGALQQLAVGHRARIVAQAQRQSRLGLQELGQGMVRLDEDRMALAGFRVHASRQGDADALHVPSEAVAVLEGDLQDADQPLVGVRGVQVIVVQHPGPLHPAPEIDQAHVHEPVIDIQAQEVAGLLAESVQVRFPAAGRFGGSQVFHIAFVDQGSDMLGDRSDAQVQPFRRLGDGARPLAGKQSKDRVFKHFHSV